MNIKHQKLCQEPCAFCESTGEDRSVENRIVVGAEELPGQFVKTSVIHQSFM